MKSKYKVLAGVLAVAFIMVAAQIVFTISLTSGGGGTYSRLSGTQNSVDWSTSMVSLTNETVSSVQTSLLFIESCVTGIEEAAATVPAEYVLCDIPLQTTAANRGKINLNSETSSGTVTGTTKISWIVHGYGQRY